MEEDVALLSERHVSPPLLPAHLASQPRAQRRAQVLLLRKKNRQSPGVGAPGRTLLWSCDGA